MCIRDRKYAVENFRVEQKTDYEKLILEITTDGSIHPKEALKEDVYKRQTKRWRLVEIIERAK